MLSTVVFNLAQKGTRELDQAKVLEHMAMAMAMAMALWLWLWSVDLWRNDYDYVHVVDLRTGAQ